MCREEREIRKRPKHTEDSYKSPTNRFALHIKDLNLQKISFSFS